MAMRSSLVVAVVVFTLAHGAASLARAVSYDYGWGYDVGRYAPHLIGDAVVRPPDQPSYIVKSVDDVEKLPADEDGLKIKTTSFEALKKLDGSPRVSTLHLMEREEGTLISADAFALLPSFPNLNVLLLSSFDSLPIISADLLGMLKACGNLQGLRISSYVILERDAWGVLSQFPKLEQLELRCSRRPTSYGDLIKAVSGNSALKRLSVGYGIVTEGTDGAKAFIDTLANLPKLEWLTLEGRFTADAFAALGGCKSLRYLRLAGDVLDESEPLNFVDNWRHIESLVIENSPTIMSGLLSHLTPDHELKDLVVHHDRDFNRHVSPSAWRAVVGLKQLRTLVLHKSGDLTMEESRALYTMPNLTTLFLIGCSCDSLHFRNIAQAKQLKTLVLIDLATLDNGTLALLRAAKSLKTLVLDDSAVVRPQVKTQMDFGDAALADVIKNLTHLETLLLFGLKRIGAETLGVLASESRVVQLGIYECGIDADELKALTNEQSRIEHLMLSEFKPSPELLAVLKDMPKLKILSHMDPNPESGWAEAVEKELPGVEFRNDR